MDQSESGRKESLVSSIDYSFFPFLTSLVMIKILLGPLNCRHNLSEFEKLVSSKGLYVDDISLSLEDLVMYIVLAVERIIHQNNTTLIISFKTW